MSLTVRHTYMHTCIHTEHTYTRTIQENSENLAKCNVNNDKTSSASLQPGIFLQYGKFDHTWFCTVLYRTGRYR